MKLILTKLYTGTAPELVDDILDTYEDQHFCIINFLYFANIVSQNVFNRDEKRKSHKDEWAYSWHAKSHFASTFARSPVKYKKILLKGDYLLPDGIALQLFYYLANLFGVIKSPRKWLENLNGTDFTPYFLEEIKKRYGNQKICLLLYGAPPKWIEKASEYISRKGFNVVHFQDGYREFEWDTVIEKIKDYHDTLNILLIGMTTPTIPMQELWTLRNYDQIKKSWLIVMNVGGFFDWWSGDQKRAPQRVRKIKLERLRRFITQPKRNFKKVMHSLKIIPYIFYYLVLKKD